MSRTRPKLGKIDSHFAAVLLAAAVSATSAPASELTIRVTNPPAAGKVFALLFDAPNRFVDLRDPVIRVALPSGGSLPWEVRDLPPGEYALVVYHDENNNERLDENFLGIPREPLGFSNGYWPQGPPAFARAAFRLDEGESGIIEIKLQSVFGKLGLLGAGVGVISQSSPYRGSNRVNVQPIPAVSYIGNRVQILGPSARYGIASFDGARVAVTASYRPGAYSEDDSDFLSGLGDRDDTLMGGIALQADLPHGFELMAGYEHDLLGRAGGGSGRLGVSKAFQRGLLTISPRLSLNWMTAELAGYEYGVPAGSATAERPAYKPGDAVDLEAGANLFIELSGAWRVILNGSAAFLPSGITGSPIVDDHRVFRGFFAVNRLF